jgi:hypothetical protein
MMKRRMLYVSEFPMEGDANVMGNLTAPIGGVNPQTRSGRTIRPPERLFQEIGAFTAQGATAAANYEIALTAAEIQYYNTMKGLGEMRENMDVYPLD